MNKIICDICGTSYPETADQCPICGTAKDVSAESLLEEEVVTATERPKGGRFAAGNGRKRQSRVEETYEEEEDTYEEDEDEEEEVDEEEIDYDDDDDDDEDDDDDDDEDENIDPETLKKQKLAAKIAAMRGLSAPNFLKK